MVGKMGSLFYGMLADGQRPENQ